ncbi:Patatin phospholipase [uncultured virus]|nr:Patatin phospholipase [uncultured virus]
MMDTTSTDISSLADTLAQTIQEVVQDCMIPEEQVMVEPLLEPSPEAYDDSQICDELSELSIDDLLTESLPFSVGRTSGLDSPTDLFEPTEAIEPHQDAVDEALTQAPSSDSEPMPALEPIHLPRQPEPTHLLRPIYFNLALSGGSVKGISHVGALKVLEERGLLDLKQLKSIAGTSAGSLLGMLIVLGFSLDEIWQFLYELDITRLMDPNPLLFLQRCGVESGQILHNFFEKILTQSTNIKHINFRQLYELTSIHYTVVGSCLTTKEAVYYDHINTPNFKVSMAVRISISMPGFFTPVSIGDRKYIDGAILDDYPMGLFADRLDETIGIMITNEFNTEYQYPEEYFRAVLNLFLYKHFFKAAEKWSANTIFVTKSAPGVNLFSFDIDQSTKKKLYQNGLDAAIDFCEKTHPSL